MLARFFILALLAACPTTGGAETQPASVYIEDMTWPELKERMLTGTDSIIIPSGGTEQNGPHIAIGKHNLIIRYTSGEIARQLGNAVVAPVIAYVPEGRIAPPEGHMRFPGTISLREEGFALVLEDAARSFKQHGFKHIYFIGDHGGNQQAQKQVAERLSREWKNDGVDVLAVEDYYTNQEAEAWALAQVPGVAKPAAHAGFMDTAELMTIDASAVRPAWIKPYTEEDFPSNGAMGDPSAATVVYGKALLAFKVKAAVAQIRTRTRK